MAKRSGQLGDAMEAAEVGLTEDAARVCRQPADYALWQMVGRQAVEATAGMTLEQRALFVRGASSGIATAKRLAKDGLPGRAEKAAQQLGRHGSPRVVPDEGFDDLD